MIAKWLTDSGLKVNETKTEICIFLPQGYPQVEIVVNNIHVKSKDHINILGVIFDSKLTWANHVAKQSNKANSALHAIKLIRKFFTKEEILQLATANFYSILFYNSKVWHIPNLKPELKLILLLASANTLKISQNNPNNYESFIDVHKSCNRAHLTKSLSTNILSYHTTYKTLIVQSWTGLN